MKSKIFSVFLIIALLFTSPLTAFAEGDGNIDNGGGGMGNGTSQNSWTPGNDGVRVTIIDTQTGKPVGTPIDYTNQSPSAGIVHFGKNSKIHYRDGSQLSPIMGRYPIIPPIGISVLQELCLLKHDLAPNLFS
jgi:hypothetical protein